MAPTATPVQIESDHANAVDYIIRSHAAKREREGNHWAAEMHRERARWAWADYNRTGRYPLETDGYTAR
jgi:hypothetical protein